MSDSVRAEVIEYLRRPSFMLMHPNDVESVARAARAGYAPVPGVSWTSEMLDAFLTDELLARVIERSATEPDMWDACVLALERFFERSLMPPTRLAAWSVSALKTGQVRPGKSGGDPLKNIAFDLRIAGAVNLASRRLGTLRAAYNMVSECLLELRQQGVATVRAVGPDAVRSVWEKYEAVIRPASGEAPVVPMGEPIE